MVNLKRLTAVVADSLRGVDEVPRSSKWARSGRFFCHAVLGLNQVFTVALSGTSIAACTSHESNSVAAKKAPKSTHRPCSVSGSGIARSFTSYCIACISGMWIM